MERELARTLETLARPFQRDLPPSVTLEVIVLDNGSVPPVAQEAVSRIIPGARVIHSRDRCVSPARAINAAIREARGDLIGLWIDGARMASPGVLKHALDAWSQDSTRAIGTLAFHLGPDVQYLTVPDGYDQAFEDALLAGVPWQSDGYRLFDISVLAGSSTNGWFGTINETNGLFMDRRLWDKIGGLDERFESPGGGFVNLDLWQRAVSASGNAPWIILGEGTFHQVHGGAATNGTDEARRLMHDEYIAVKGVPFAGSDYQPVFIGSLTERSFAAGSARPLDKFRRARSCNLRPFACSLPSKQLSEIQSAVLKTRYKGLRLAKSPFDLVLYLQLIERVRPASIIEIGTSEGGSAVWLRDQCRAIGLNPKIISIDLRPPKLNEDGILLAEGNAEDPRGTFPHAEISALPHPWIVTEDSAHSYTSVAAVLDYFDPQLQPGDWMVVEDGIVADLEGAHYRAYEDGPNRAVDEFLRRKGKDYEVAADLCDFYGENVTWAPGGWLRRL